ncbi:hypothetical protein BJY01DRAFT_165208 [Aspergillus pseudoustus]|uniref:Uncharacterized protein n=1 Tax=Aspergillus pseudoustus TaxID=1810923 RepID=A0ABR4I9R3_9EURO
MAVGDAYKARIAEKRAIGANRGELDEGSGSKKAAATGAGAGTGAEIEHVEAVAVGDEKPKRRQRIKRHFARFWCCYLLASIVFLAIFLPVFFLVAIPAIAQRLVDDTDLPVYAAHITDPKPDRVTFTLDTGLTIPLGLSVRLDAFNLSLFNRDSDPEITYLEVPVPSYKVKGKTNISVTSEDTPVLDQDEFVKTLSQAVYSKRFTMSAIGRTTGHLGAIKAGITLDKDVEINGTFLLFGGPRVRVLMGYAGLDKLSGFSIDEAALILPAREDGTNLRGRATLPNHSVVTFAMGNVTLNLKSGSIILGTALLPDVTLLPGNNSVGFTGIADINSALANIGPILASQTDALRDGEIELSASGNQTIFNGEHIRYFERVLNDLTITARVPIIKILLDTAGEFFGSDSGGVVDELTDILNKIDFGSLFAGVDFDSLIGSVGDIINNLNLGSLLDGVDLNSLLTGIDWPKVVDAVGSILGQLDLGSFLQNLDIPALLQSIDWQNVFQSIADMLGDIDWGQLANTLNTILNSVDWSALLEQIQPVLDQINWGDLLSNLDLSSIINSIGPILQNIDLGAIFSNIDWGTVIQGLGSVLQNVDLGSLFSGLMDALQSLDLGSLFDFDVGGVNIGDVLGEIGQASNGTSLDDAFNNFMDALENLGSDDS